jgi:hypothetical protein
MSKVVIAILISSFGMFLTGFSITLIPRGICPLWAIPFALVFAAPSLLFGMWIGFQLFFKP